MYRCSEHINIKFSFILQIIINKSHTFDPIAIYPGWHNHFNSEIVQLSKCGKSILNSSNSMQINGFIFSCSRAVTLKINTAHTLLCLLEQNSNFKLMLYAIGWLKQYIIAFHVKTYKNHYHTVRAL